MKADNLLNYTISFTGHSLGAYLASITSISTNNKAIVFECPGTLNALDKLNLLEETSAVNVVCYNTAPNWINTWNKHEGLVYQIQNPEENQLATGRIPLVHFVQDLTFGIHLHSTDNLERLFNTVSGEPHFQLAMAYSDENGLQTDFYYNSQTRIRSMNEVYVQTFLLCVIICYTINNRLRKPLRKQASFFGSYNNSLIFKFFPMNLIPF